MESLFAFSKQNVQWDDYMYQIARKGTCGSTCTIQRDFKSFGQECKTIRPGYANSTIIMWTKWEKHKYELLIQFVHF